MREMTYRVKSLHWRMRSDAAKKEASVANASLQERSQGEGMDQSELDSLSAVNDTSFINQFIITMVTEFR